MLHILFSEITNLSSLNPRGSETCIYVKNIFTCIKYENETQITCGEPFQGIQDVWVSIQVSKFKSIVVGAVYKHSNTNPDCIVYLEILL